MWHIECVCCILYEGTCVPVGTGHVLSCDKLSAWQRKFVSLMLNELVLDCVYALINYIGVLDFSPQCSCAF